MFEKIVNMRHKSRSFLCIAAVIAVIFFTVLSYTLLSPQDTNNFSITAYAMKFLEDGLMGMSEVDIIDQPDILGGYYDRENGLFYISVGLRCDGENIKSVEFFVEDGFFAKQYYGDLKYEEGVSMTYVGADHRLVMVGEDFEIAGHSLVLGKDDMADNLLLFWGMETETPGLHPRDLNLPEKIDMLAKATFNDGATSTLPVTIDISKTGIYSYMRSEKEIEVRKEKLARIDYYRNLPLVELELMSESVKPLTTPYSDIGNNELYYEYETDPKFGAATLIQEENLEFDESGIARNAIIDGTYVVVIKHDDDGELVGMLYKLPAHAIEDLCFRDN